MHSKFYRVVTDPKLQNGWFLDEPRALDDSLIGAREFTQGEFYFGSAPVRIPLAQCGDAKEFNFGAFDMPVISSSISRIIQRYAATAIQLFSVKVESCENEYHIMNVGRKIRCIDESNTDFVKWGPEDGRVEKLGQYRMIANININPLLCAEEHIFRIDGWEIALIISDDLKSAIESVGNLGIAFVPV